MKTKWTKGSWKVETEGGSVGSIDANGTPVAYAQPHSMDADNVTRIANAYLISAAPDLYNGHLMQRMLRDASMGATSIGACSFMEECGYTGGDIDSFVDAYIETAMMKAKGEFK